MSGYRKKRFFSNAGISWSGGTVCVAPYTCKELNDYVRMVLILVNDSDRFFFTVQSVSVR